MFKKIYQKLEKSLSKISKRKRFILSTIILTIAVLSTTLLGYQNSYLTIPFTLILVYILTVLSILEGIKRKEWIMLFIIPVYFTLALTLVYFFIPQRWLTRLPFLILYSVSIYAIMLSQNIFNVGAQKSLQLYRAAFSVNYLFITITSFIIFNLILSFRLNFLQNAFFVTLASLPLSIHFFWSSDPQEIISKEVIQYGILISVIIGEMTLIFSFIAVSISIFALFITTLFYCLLGIFQAHIQQILYKERIREYLFVLGFIILIVLLSINW